MDRNLVFRKCAAHISISYLVDDPLYITRFACGVVLQGVSGTALQDTVSKVSRMPSRAITW